MVLCEQGMGTEVMDPDATVVDGSFGWDGPVTSPVCD